MDHGNDAQKNILIGVATAFLVGIVTFLVSSDKPKKMAKHHKAKHFASKGNKKAKGLMSKLSDESTDTMSDGMDKFSDLSSDFKDYMQDKAKDTKKAVKKMK